MGDLVEERILNGLRCPRCRYVVFSRANHDFRSCPCDAIKVDAGPGVGRYLWDPALGSPKWVLVDVRHFMFPALGAHEKLLYDDWNEYKDRYGLIHPGSWLRHQRVI